MIKINRIISFVVIILLILNFFIILPCLADEEEKSLHIIAPDTIEEGNIFTITVLYNKTPLENITVTFANHKRLTNSHGNTTFTAPGVENDSFYSINVTYNSITDFVQIKIINVPELRIVIDDEDNTICLEPFTVYVLSGTTPIEDVTVVFNGKDYYTDESGMVIIDLSDFYDAGDYQLSATKDGFHHDLTVIHVEVWSCYNQAREIFFLNLICYLFIILFVVLIIILIYRHYKKKNNEE